MSSMNVAFAASDDVERTLAAWVDAEFRPWRAGSLERAAIEECLRDEARRNGQVCLFRLRGGSVDFAPFTAMHRPDLLDRAHSSGARAQLYLEHLREVVHGFGISGSALIGIYVADLHLPRPRAPVFCFQKRAGDRGLLMPDVELLYHDYCASRDGGYDDRLPFEAKRPQAVFVGSTTGTQMLTLDDVRRRANARLEAALYFRDEPGVTFRLPNIVQYDWEETRAAIEALGVGGRHWSWAEQQEYRYMLSLDGNGASCSRVAATLHGHQLLAKYASPYILYYFHGLRPWQHYVPINEHGDVLDLVAETNKGFALHRDIAECSRHFARRFLTREPIMRYSALMLSAYIARFGEDGAS